VPLNVYFTCDSTSSRRRNLKLNGTFFAVDHSSQHVVFNVIHRLRCDGGQMQVTCGRLRSMYVIVFKRVFFASSSTFSCADTMESQHHGCYLFSDLSPSIMPVSVRFFTVPLQYYQHSFQDLVSLDAVFDFVGYVSIGAQNVTLFPLYVSFFFSLRVAGMSHYYAPVFIQVPRCRRWCILGALYTDCL
jgi:hypothetical protein